jgi:large subunit ribosomal protein L15
MPHDKRKMRKRRGSRQQGWGQVGQHRGPGRRGGTGLAGRHKGKWTYVVKHEPGYFGKDGFRNPTAVYVEAINVGRLSEMALDLISEGKAAESQGKIAVDLEKLGYAKLLGAGSVSKPLVVTVASASRRAEDKIKKAGGEVVKPG